MNKDIPKTSAYNFTSRALASSKIRMEFSNFEQEPAHPQTSDLNFVKKLQTSLSSQEESVIVECIERLVSRIYTSSQYYRISLKFKDENLEREYRKSMH